MTIKLKPLAVSIAIPLAVGGFSALLTRGNMSVFDEVTKPPLSPPAWLFPVVWTILYILMGVACYLVYTSKENSKDALILYGIQIFFNFWWSLIFFNLKAYLLSFIWLVAMWVFILLTTLSFYKISKLAAYLMIPYLAWVTFAGYLNLGIYLLN